MHQTHSYRQCGYWPLPDAQTHIDILTSKLQTFNKNFNKSKLPGPRLLTFFQQISIRIVSKTILLIRWRPNKTIIIIISITIQLQRTEKLLNEKIPTTECNDVQTLTVRRESKNGIFCFQFYLILMFPPVCTNPAKHCVSTDKNTKQFFLLSQSFVCFLSVYTVQSAWISIEHDMFLVRTVQRRSIVCVSQSRPINNWATVWRIIGIAREWVWHNDVLCLYCDWLCVCACEK